MAQEISSSLINAVACRAMSHVSSDGNKWINSFYKWKFERWKFQVSSQHGQGPIINNNVAARTLRKNNKTVRSPTFEPSWSLFSHSTCTLPAKYNMNNPMRYTELILAMFNVCQIFGKLILSTIGVQSSFREKGH